MPPPNPNMPPPQMNPQVAAFVQMLSAGISEVLLRQLQGMGGIHPGTPVMVERHIDENPVVVQTTVPQLLAELNDHLSDLNDMTEEALEEGKARRRRRRK